jgi:hypothetical protein
MIHVKRMKFLMTICGKSGSLESYPVVFSKEAEIGRNEVGRLCVFTGSCSQRSKSAKFVPQIKVTPSVVIFNGEIVIFNGEMYLQKEW